MSFDRIFVIADLMPVIFFKTLNKCTNTECIIALIFCVFVQQGTLKSQ